MKFWQIIQNAMSKKWWGIFGVFLMVVCSEAYSQSKISAIEIEGNRRVAQDAIEAILSSSSGQVFNEDTVRDDILALHELGYFADIQVFKEKTPAGLKLLFKLTEKPAVAAIRFSGLDEVKESDLTEKLESKLYTIVNESNINNDVRMIEKAYLEKGFYLATATYQLNPIEGSDYEVELEFVINEGGKIRVGDVFLEGNKYFSNTELLAQMFSKPYTRGSFLSGPGSIYNSDFVRRDTEFLSYLYQDQGFAEIEIPPPTQVMDKDRRFVRLSFEINEGIQYSVGEIKVSGDVLYELDEIKEWMELKQGELFRFSRFRRDVEVLIDKYGDLGYAFVDVNPKTRFDKEKALVYLDYEITKGEKVYFGEFTFVGNTKTRDNVIRRELEVTDGELYSGTRLAKSRQNIERLGFFEEVQSIKSRDAENPSVLNYRFQVKERPTGQLQAAIGFSPNAEGGESSFFGQGRYSEENQSGKGWRTSFTGRWNGGRNYSLELGFTEPRLRDSDWSVGFNGFWRNDLRLLTDGVQLQEGRRGGSFTVGKRIFEEVRAAVTFRITQIFQDSDVFILDRFRQDGQANSLIFSLARNATNNYIDPSEGSVIRLSQEFTGGILGGDRQYLESVADSSFYLPIDFSETYRSYFRLAARVGLLWPFGGENIPLFTRYTLGGPENLRGYRYREIGPKYTIVQTPGDRPREINGGGNKELLFQFEYFLPLIQEANIKGLVFYDMGRVFNEDEALELSDFTRDVGFGFRWITPVAPFRFEWAYPIENGELGDLEFIFYLGY